MQGRQDGIRVELDHHVFKIANPGEVQFGIMLPQQLVVGPQLPEL